MLSPEQHRAAQAMAAQARACWTFGMLIAQGRMTAEEVMPALVAAAREAEPNIPPALVRSTLAELLRQRIEGWAYVRDGTKRRIWGALDPLVAERKPARDMLAEAHRVNARAERPPGLQQHPWSYTRPLARHEVNDGVRKKLEYVMRQQKRG